MNVICISGKAECGKDTFASHFKEIAKREGKKACILHYGDYLKFIAKNVYGWSGKKDEEGRALLQWLGTDVVRKQYPELWVNVVSETIKGLSNEFDYFLIPDARFPNEVVKMNREFKNSFSIRICRPYHENILTEKQRKHESETALDDFNFDIYYSANNMDENRICATELFYDIELNRDEILRRRKFKEWDDR